MLHSQYDEIGIVKRYAGLSSVIVDRKLNNCIRSFVPRFYDSIKRNYGYTRKNYAIRRISYLKRLKCIDEAKNGILVIFTKAHYYYYDNCIIQSSNLMDGKYLFSKIGLTSRQRSTYARITAHNTSTSRCARVGSIQLVGSGAGRTRKHDESEHRGQPAV